MAQLIDIHFAPAVLFDARCCFLVEVVVRPRAAGAHVLYPGLCAPRGAALHLPRHIHYAYPVKVSVAGLELEPPVR
jgi:hypothetical protein